MNTNQIELSVKFRSNSTETHSFVCPLSKPPRTSRNLKSVLECLLPPLDGTHTGVWQQSKNVPFEQSRNVPLTAPDFGDARRTATDDASGPRPVGDVAKSREESNHATSGGGGIGCERAASEAALAGFEEARGQGCGAWAARTAIEAADQRERGAAGSEDLVGGGVRRIRTDAGSGISAQQA